MTKTKRKRNPLEYPAKWAILPKSTILLDVSIWDNRLVSKRSEFRNFKKLSNSSLDLKNKTVDCVTKNDLDKVKNQLNNEVKAAKRKVQEIQNFIQKQAHYYDNKNKSIFDKIESFEILEKKLNTSLT